MWLLNLLANFIKTKMKGHGSLPDNYIPKVSWQAADIPKVTHLLWQWRATVCRYTAHLAAPGPSITSHLQVDQPNHVQPKPKPFDPGEVKSFCMAQGRRRSGTALNSLGIFRWQRTRTQRKGGFVHLTGHWVSWEPFSSACIYWPYKGLIPASPLPSFAFTSFKSLT